jgi:hypothetical protein
VGNKSVENQRNGKKRERKGMEEMIL